MNKHPRPLLAAIAAACLAATAQAERADRFKPITIQADQSGQVDLQKQVAVFSGNVVVTKGTMVIHAARIEVSKTPGGYDTAVAFGAAGKPATFRQKRDGVDEFSEGDAQRIEYDSAANRVRFVDAAHLRMLKGTVVTDQASAALITYDTATDTVKLGAGGTEGAAASSAGGRTTVVFTPKAPGSAPPPKPLELPTPASGSGK